MPFYDNLIFLHLSTSVEHDELLHSRPLVGIAEI